MTHWRQVIVLLSSVLQSQCDQYYNFMNKNVEPYNQHQLHQNQEFDPTEYEASISLAKKFFEIFMKASA